KCSRQPPFLFPVPCSLFPRLPDKSEFTDTFAAPVPSLRSGKAFDYPGLDTLKTPASFAGGGLQRTQRDSNP
ncbi:MAG: hypothetical protein IJI59_09020, partial [Clostridia bacterium]|nr:hypothetical protein [Clostridia bacterium]